VLKVCSIESALKFRIVDVRRRKKWKQSEDFGD
jgi:hypothetical protein